MPLLGASNNQKMLNHPDDCIEEEQGGKCLRIILSQNVELGKDYPNNDNEE